MKRQEFSKGVPPLVVDKALEDLLPSPLAEQLTQLEASLLADGCLNPIVVWDQGVKYVIVDGHQRYRICKKHGISHSFKRLEFTDKTAAKIWMYEHQDARRNYTDEQRKYASGQLYLLKKQSHGGDRKDQVDKLSTCSEVPKTADILAKDQNVNERTVRRAADFAEAVDAIGEASPELKAAILAGETKATTAELAALAEAPKRTVAAVAKRVEAGDKRAIKDAVAEREPGDDSEAIAADKAKRKASGKEVVSPKDRKAALTAFAAVVKFIDKIKRHDDCRKHLEAILAVIKGQSA